RCLVAFIRSALLQVLIARGVTQALLDLPAEVLRIVFDSHGDLLPVSSSRGVWSAGRDFCARSAGLTVGDRIRDHLAQTGGAAGPSLCPGHELGITGGYARGERGLDSRSVLGIAHVTLLR